MFRGDIFKQGWIKNSDLKSIIKTLGKSSYADYLKN